jgi:hypothetical protein
MAAVCLLLTVLLSFSSEANLANPMTLGDGFAKMELELIEAAADCAMVDCVSQFIGDIVLQYLRLVQDAHCDCSLHLNEDQLGSDHSNQL